MKKSYRATSIIEAMVVLLIVVVGITGVFSLMTSSSKLADSTWRRIEAIQIARDGLEAFTNIRDTNWIKFWADYENCWNTLNYDSNCIWDSSSPYQSNYIEISNNQGIRISRNANNQFFIWIQSHGWNNNFWDTWYIDLFQVKKDPNGIYSQSPSALNTLKHIYTREIQVDYLKVDWSLGNKKDPIMKVTAIVQWQDIAKNEPQKIEMSTKLTNWKSKK